MRAACCSAMSDSPFATSILVTGGAGFLGRGLLRYCQRNKIDARVTVYSRDEGKHYALRARYPRVHTVLGDIRDTDRLAAVMAGHDLVIHMAALKYIPEAERDTEQAIAVNVDGTRSVVKAAMRSGVSRVVGISTDKAASPRNTYGASKMMAERVLQEAQRYAPHMHFNNVRYGNVISSTGSVVPLFLDQLKRDNQVTITSPAMTRFWLSIDDAVRLIECAASPSAKRGSTYVPLCAAMRITDVAQAVALYAGRTGPGTMRLIGLRPGEKLHETLVDSYEAPYCTKTDDGRYIIIPPAMAMQGEGSSDIMPYSSDMPNHWMSPDEFAALITDAAQV